MCCLRNIALKSVTDGRTAVYANYIGPSVMTDANSEGFPICDETERITENDQCVIKIIGIHWDRRTTDKVIPTCRYASQATQQK